MRKRFLSLALCVLMFFSLFPITAFAEGEDDSAHSTDLLSGAKTEEIDANESEEIVEQGKDSVSSEEERYKSEEPENSTSVDEEMSQTLEQDNEESLSEELVFQNEDNAESVFESVTDAEDIKIERIRVEFICSPEHTQVAVFAMQEMESDEGSELIKSEKDGSYLLTLGDYFYTAYADGYITIEEKAFSIRSSEEPIRIRVTLETVLASEKVEQEETENELTDGADIEIEKVEGWKELEETQAINYEEDENENKQEELDLVLSGGLADISASSDAHKGDSDSNGKLNKTGNNTKSGIIADGTCGEHATWALSEDGVFTVSGTGPMTDYSQNYYPSNVPWANYKTSIKELIVESGITSIGNYCFDGCSNLESFILPDSVVYINYRAFYYCSGLTSITMPCSVIISNSFYGCTSITNIHLTKGTGTVRFNDLTPWNSTQAYPLTIILDEGITYIGDSAFLGSKTLKSIIIPDGLMSIGESAFSNCSSLSSINIPESVTVIGNRAFFKCNELASVTIPNNVPSIEDSTFSNCTSLTTVTIGKNVGSIGESAFYNCMSLTDVYYIGTPNMRNRITFWTQNEKLKNARWHYLPLLSIGMKTLPTKLTYIVNYETLDVKGGSIATYYGYEIEEEVSLTAEMVSGFDNTSIGTKTLTVTYEDKTTTFDVEIIPMPVDHITMSKLPTKKRYLEGKDALDVTGGKVKVYYADNTTETIDLTEEMVSSFDNTVVGPQTLTVTYKEKTNTFSITIIAKSLDHVAVTTLPDKTEYLEGKETLDVTGGIVTLYYNNDTTEEVDLTAGMVSGFDNTVVGSQALTVTIGGKTTTFDVEIIAKALDHIEVTTLPDKTEYLEGQVLDLTGGKVTVYYNNDTAEVIDLTAEMVSGFDNTVVGVQALTVTYEGKTTTFEITVIRNGDIELNETKLRLNLISNKTFQLALTLDDGTAVGCTWSSANDSIAKVDESGLVKAVKPGVTKISATSTESHIVRTCRVRVLFSDTREESSYYFVPVYWAFDNGITTGYTSGENAGKFGIGDACTREQAVTFLWRMMGSPKPSQSAPFKDVKEGAYYYDAISWAAEQGITTGYSGTGKFGVGDKCTREQIVTFLYRAVGSPAVSSYASFSDVQTGTYYYNAISWAAEHGITTGYTSGANAGKFGVGDFCKREQIVTFIYRYASAYSYLNAGSYTIDNV